MGEIIEAAKVLVSPVEKLIEGIQKALGKAFEPHHLRKMADAQAYQIKTISKAMRETSDIPIEYNRDGIALSTTDYDEFVKRTQSRLAFQELKKQENIETVAGKALNILDGKPNIERQEADVDWLMHFFNSVECVSNEEMQDIWAKILAGEIQQPGSFSLRTLGKIRNLTQKEAQLFQQVSTHCLCSGSQMAFIINDQSIIDQAAIPYKDIINLDECGLVLSNGLLQFTKEISQKNEVLAWCDQYTIVARTKKEGSQHFRIQIYPLTNAGYELMRIIHYKMGKHEIINITEKLKSNYPNVEFTIHEILENDEVIIRYANKNVLDDQEVIP